MKVSDLIDDLVAGRRRTLAVGGFSLPWPFPVAYALSSSSAMVFGRPVYGSDQPRYIKWCHRAFRYVEDAKYWLFYRFHPRHRYHLIDTGLGYGYHERDDRLLHGALACLIGYVEDCDHTGVHDPGDEARAILHWWHIQRPADQAQIDQWMHDLYADGKSRMTFAPVPDMPRLQEVVFPERSPEDEAKQKAMWALEQKMRDDEQAFLHRLIDIRPGMWT